MTNPTLEEQVLARYKDCNKLKASLVGKVFGFVVFAYVAPLILGAGFVGWQYLEVGFHWSLAITALGASGAGYAMWYILMRLTTKLKIKEHDPLLKQVMEALEHPTNAKLKAQLSLDVYGCIPFQVLWQALAVEMNQIKCDLDV